MRLSELVAVLSQGQILSMPDDPVIRGVTCDSRRLEKDFVFVAIPGALTDGHLFIDEAVSKGAVAIVCERPAFRKELAEIRVPNARRAQAELSRAFFSYPDRGLFMIGVTGTNGKTTTTSMVQHILTDHGVMTSLIGSVAYGHGAQKTQSVLTTPESTDLHAMLREFLDEGVKVVSMEVSSIAEAQYRVFGIEYDAVAYLNITPDHMPDHGSFEAYSQAKAKLVRDVARGIPVILNRDQPEVYQLRHETPGEVISIGINNPKADVSAEKVTLPGGIPQFDLLFRRPLNLKRETFQQGRWPVSLRVPGRHSIYNAMAAVILAASCGIRPQDAIRSLSAFPGVERRLQIIYQKEFTLIDDHISDEDNTRKMLEALAVMTEGRPVRIIYAIRGSRGVEVNREVIGQFREFRDRINWQDFVLTSSRDTAKKRDHVLEKEYLAVTEDLQAAGYDFTYEENLTDSIKRVLAEVRPDEFMVLAGSHNMDQGARIALNLLAASKPEDERGAILEILQGRLMG
ncbi:MAG TPA: Mur ligase family protein [Bacillota bacterium]|jgi:UDP-N-acetylmuramoyl-L-alanyl-D-glutamate--2,6-diaminopimelate ligase|nr:hypothetical protein [Fastidiosipila sp.]HPX93550.1 Mur ligase family protein [Bacillota bacterium]HQB81763.1 Mur ligase family protein [Bacillota bacterium]